MKHQIKQKLVKFTLWIPAIIAMIFMLSSCTQEQRAKAWGGTAEVHIKEGLKVMGVTWKDNTDLWITTRKMLPNEKADTIYFIQHTGKVWTMFGGNGEVMIIEHNQNLKQKDSLNVN